MSLQTARNITSVKPYGKVSFDILNGPVLPIVCRVVNKNGNIRAKNVEICSTSTGNTGATVSLIGSYPIACGLLSKLALHKCVLLCACVWQDIQGIAL